MPADHPAIIPCREWGATPVDTSALSRYRALGITIHHTASKNVSPLADPAKERARCFRLARGIQADHLNRGYQDTGNHFLIARGGLVLEGRHGSLVQAEAGYVIHGAHAGDAWVNAHHFGLESEGLYVTAAMPAAQWEALADLCAWLAWKGAFDTQSIFPHRRWRNTQCPGDALAARMDELRATAHERKLILMQG